MSQPNMAGQNMPNGMDQFRPQYQFNGVHSSNSSRDPSPAPRLGTIPPSQLPPGRPNIPASQLPPSRSPITTVTQKMGQMSVANHVTPNISPKFSTSTPTTQPAVLQNPVTFGQNSAFSPITVPTSSNRTQVLDNVPLNNSGSETIAKSNQVTNQNQTVQGGVNNPPTFNPAMYNAGQIRPPGNTAAPNYPPQMNYPAAIPPSVANYQNGPPKPSPVNQGYQQNTNLNNNARVQNLPPPPNQQPIFNNRYPNQPISQQQPLNQQQGSKQQSLGPPPLNQQQPLNQPPLGQQPLNKPPLGQPPLIPQSFNQQLNQPPLQRQYGQPVQNQQFGQQPLTQQFNQPPLTQQLNQPPLNQQLNQQLNQPPLTQQSFNQPQLNSQAFKPPPLNPQSLNQTPLNQQSFNQRPPLNQQPYQQYSQPQLPSQPKYPQQPNVPYGGVVQTGFSKFWGTENVDLLQQPNILPPTKVEAPKVHLSREALDQANCSPDILRCTLTKIPENNSLLQKSRLPLGVLIHPFKDLNHLPVIQCNVIVRCRTCRTYINPFVYFVDSKRWKCNLCYRINELPEEFQYDPVSKSYGDPSRRPEIKSSTIEYIAPAEYMLRPPQPAVYLFLLDISRLAIESGYLHTVCNILLEELKNLPGDARTQIGFIAYDSALHFYSFAEGLSQPHEMTVLEVDDVFLPCPDNLLVNLKGRMELVTDLLGQLPTRYNNSYDNSSALGAALQAAFKMMGPTGGRVTVFQASLPNCGPGSLVAREDPSQRSNVEVAHLNPANDFYKRLALECSGQQIAVDLFIVNSQYVDVATISGISRFSGGCMHHFPLFKASRTLQNEALERSFRRYLTRKIGFEAVMRIRCTRGLAIQTFHGNFFVRSTDLLSLPNINPDAGFGMQIAIEESLADVQTVCFQAALLYTSSKGERRIRVHTLCLPVTATLQDVINSADQQCIVGLLSKMAVDRSMQSSLSDAREAFINVAIDILSSYKFSLNMGNGQSGLLAPQCLKLLPLYISALLKHAAFRTGTNTRLDDRVKAMLDMKSKPLCNLIQQIYPDLYPIHNLEAEEVYVNAEDESIPMPPRLQLTARSLDNAGAFLMDTGDHLIILVCPNASKTFLNDALGIHDYNSITDQTYEIPILNNPHNQRLHNFINHLNDEKPYAATLQIMRDNSPNRMQFLERLIEDRVENALSYHEFLQHLKSQVK